LILRRLGIPTPEPAIVQINSWLVSYNDEMKLVEEKDESRRRYEIYGFEPSFEDEDGTDLTAIAHGRIAVTPIHFDLTDHGGLDRLRGWNLEQMLEGLGPAAEEPSRGAKR